MSEATKLTNRSKLALLAIGTLLLPALLSATAIEGNISITAGSGNLVRVGNYIPVPGPIVDAYTDFYPVSSNPIPTTLPPVGSTGNFDVNSASGYFGVAGLNLAVAGNQNSKIKDLVQSRQPAGVWGPPFQNLANFFLFNTAPGLNFVVENVPACVGALYPAGPCVLDPVAGYSSPFYFQDLPGTGSLVSFGVRGEVFNGSDYGVFNGLISGTFVGQTGAQVLANLVANNYVETSWSGTIDSFAIPEPATLLLTGGALLALAGFLRKFRR
jgi:hypothetical protein